MSLEVTVLGCSGSYPGPGDAASGYLVRGGGANVVVDLGPGTLANLQRHVPLETLDAVVLTHRHPDHWTDLTGLHTALKYGSDRVGLQVWGTPEGRDLAEELTGGLAPTLVWHDLSPSALLVVNGLCFTFGPTVHYVPTFAVRVDGPAGELLVYSADTGPSWPLGALTHDSPIFAGRVEADRPIDLLLCESTHLTEREGDGVLHLSGRQAGVLARSAGVRRLVLTHLWPTDDPDQHRAEATEAFGAPVEVAVTNQTYDVGRREP
jgi:ribonuclease BN (tRNA processing enzyme)